MIKNKKGKKQNDIYCIGCRRQRGEISTQLEKKEDVQQIRVLGADQMMTLLLLMLLIIMVMVMVVVELVLVSQILRFVFVQFAAARNDKTKWKKSGRWPTHC